MIKNRRDGYGNRLKNLEIRVGSEAINKLKTGMITKNTLCAIYAGPGGNGEIITIKFKTPTDGKYVTLQLKDNPTIMNIAEVEVFGQGKIL